MRIAPIVPAGAKECSRCRKIKPLAEFYRRHAGRGGKASWCATCVRIAKAEACQSDAYRAWYAAYRARPEVLARRRELALARYRRYRDERNPRRRTARARLMAARHQAARKLRVATDPARRARLLGLVAAHERELARIDAAAGLVPRWRPVGETMIDRHPRGGPSR